MENLAKLIQQDIMAKRGIIVFWVHWTNAIEHITLINSQTYREPRYDDYSHYINQRNSSIRTLQSIFREFN